MPGVTPVFGIQYPCAGENIDPLAFLIFALGVENALDVTRNAANATLQRPRAAIRDAGTSIPFSVNTAFAFDTTDFVSGLGTSGAGFTVASNGLYMVDLECGTETVPTTVTSWAAEIAVDGAVKYRRKQSQAATSIPPENMDLNVSGLLYASAGQVVSFSFQWTGTGINVNTTARATISLICAI